MKVNILICSLLVSVNSFADFEFECAFYSTKQCVEWINSLTSEISQCEVSQSATKCQIERFSDIAICSVRNSACTDIEGIGFSYPPSFFCPEGKSAVEYEIQDEDYNKEAFEIFWGESHLGLACAPTSSDD